MFFIKKYGLYIIFLLVIIGFTFYPKKVANEVIVEEVVTEKEIINKIKVDIKGAVKKPGVYEIDSNLRIIDAINLSGGLKTTADTSNINLSKTLFDQMVIVVKTKEEAKEPTVIIEYVETTCIKEEEVIIDNSTDEGKISINTGTLEELDSLPGIGLSKATDIINYREANGLFTTIEDIKNVSGIGESVFNQIKDLIKI